jgi:sarcosine oxidase delta subunit
MTTLDDKPKKSELLRRWMDFIFGFENKRGQVLASWLSHADGFSCSPLEFYTNVEQQLATKKIPSMEITRQEFAEGGLLSDQRVYLRLMRERLAIITCAAPFGDIFFFSCRTVYVPALVRLWHILAVLFCLSVIGQLLIIPLGVIFAGIAMITLPFAIAGVLRNASEGAFSDLDTLLLKIPVVATIYEDWFRVETYYREDTRSLYVQLMPALIKDLAAETCAAKGVRLEQQFQPTPAIANLDQPLLPDKKPPAI